MKYMTKKEKTDHTIIPSGEDVDWLICSPRAGTPFGGLAYFRKDPDTYVLWNQCRYCQSKTLRKSDLCSCCADLRKHGVIRLDGKNYRIETNKKLYKV